MPVHRPTRGMVPFLLCALFLLLVACGGGAGTDDPPGGLPDDTTGGGSPPGGPPPGGPTGVVMPPFDASTLTGGVLATFQVGADQFRGWFTRTEATDRLIAAWAGTGAPITTICTRIRTGPGAQGHNAPWSWSVDTLLPPDFDGFCAACASTWPTPLAVETGITGPSPMNCTIPGPAAGFEARAFMACTLIDVIDRR